MANNSLDAVIRHVRTLVGAQGDHSDGELLRAFAAGGDQAAFAALTKRHGPLVLAVCRRVLHQLQDAEDAFQATFIVLARQAASLSKKGSLGGWLHRVAYRIALDARRADARRRKHERRSPTVSPSNPALQAAWREMQIYLDEEIQRLPEKYREPFILCCLESQSCAAVARRLGLKEATIWSRLAEARKRLQKRLSRRGVELTAVLGAAALAPDPIVAAALVTKVVSAATLPAVVVSARVAFLVHGMTRCLMLQKAKMGVVVFLAVSAIVGGTGVFQLSRAEDKKPGVTPVAKEKAEAPARKVALTDLYGDALPEGAVARLGTVRLRNNGSLYGVSFSPDGKILASTGLDEAIRLWNAKTGRLIAVLGNPGRVPTVCLAFSPDSTKLASGGDDLGEVRLWNALTGRMLFEKKTQGNLVYGIAFAPDGGSFASASGTVQVWNARTGAELLTLGPRDAESHVVAFSPDGKLLAGNRKEDICVWDAKTGALLRLIPSHAERVRSIVFTDSNTFAACGDGQNGQIGFWDVATGKRIVEIGTASRYVDSLTLSADGKRLGAAGEDKIRIWQLRGPSTVGSHADFSNSFARSSFQNHLSFSPDGKTLAAVGTDSVVRLWDIFTGKRILDYSDAHSGRVLSVAFFPDGGKILTSGTEGTVRIWDAVTGKQLRVHQGEAKVGTWTVATMSADGMSIAAGGHAFKNGQWCGPCTIWDTVTGKELHTFTFPHWVESLAFSRNGKNLAIGGMNTGPQGQEKTATYLWNFTAGKELVKLPERDERSVGLAFSPNGKTLASVGSRSLSLWDVAAKKQRAKFALPETTGSAAFSADGNLVVTSKAFGEALVVHEILTGKTLSTFNVKDTSGSALALSPDGRILASSQIAHFNTRYDYDTAIHLWEMPTGREVLQFQPGDSDARTLSFSADGRRLISGMENGTALVWNVKPSSVKAPSPEALERLWQDFARDDAAVAYAANCEMGANPNVSVPFLKNRLLSVPEINVGRVRSLIKDLGNEAYPVRQAASKELGKLGDTVTNQLRLALADKPSLELRKRLQALLKAAGELRPGVNVRRMRAIQVLEDIGSESALEILQKLADVSPATAESEDARLSLERAQRRVSQPR